MRRQILPIVIVALFAAGADAAEPPTGLEAALSNQRALAARQPGDPAVLNDLGNLLSLAGEVEEAEAAYLEALSISPESVPARFNLALLLQGEGRLRAAWRELRQVLRARPDHAWAQYQAVSILAGRGRRSRALEHYAEALRLDPRLAEPSFNPHIIQNRLAVSALLMSQRRTTGAEAVPRTYTQPARITELLLPGAAPAAAPDEAAAESEPAAAPAGEEVPTEEVTEREERLPATPRQPLPDQERPEPPDG